MSKKGSKEQRKKAAARAAVTAKQEADFARKNPDYVKPEKQDKKENEEVQIKMNFYSAMAMLTTLVSTGAFAVAMIVLPNARNYAVLSECGDAYDPEILVDFLKEEGAWGSFVPYLAVALGALVVVTILSLMMTGSAMNAYKKPSMVQAVVMTTLSALALMMYLMADRILQDGMEKLTKLQPQSQFGIYNVYFILLIVNVVIAFINVFGTLYGCSKFNKTGHTC